MNVEFDVIIPARFQSTRLPGKVLEDINGKSMIHRVVEQAQSSHAERVIVATDDDRIEAEVAAKTDAMVCRTEASHATGTDRIAEAVTKLGMPLQRIVVNVQGDEPLIPGKLIDEVAENLNSNPDVQVATAVQYLLDREDWRNPDIVKCVVSASGSAIYFSRSPIPWMNPEIGQETFGLHHIGIYAYHVSYLLQHSNRERCELERMERLEQLRMLYYGDRVSVYKIDSRVFAGVDNARDLERVRKIIATRESKEQA